MWLGEGEETLQYGHRPAGRTPPRRPAARQHPDVLAGWIVPPHGPFGRAANAQVVQNARTWVAHALTNNLRSHALKRC